MALPHYNMIWWSLIVVCYAANLRDTLSLSELKETTSTSVHITGLTYYGNSGDYNIELGDKMQGFCDMIKSTTEWVYPGNRCVLNRKLAAGGEEEFNLEKTFEEQNVHENDTIMVASVRPPRN